MRIPWNSKNTNKAINKPYKYGNTIFLSTQYSYFFWILEKTARWRTSIPVFLVRDSIVFHQAQSYLALWPTIVPLVLPHLYSALDPFSNPQKRQPNYGPYMVLLILFLALHKDSCAGSTKHPAKLVPCWMPSTLIAKLLQQKYIYGKLKNAQIPHGNLSTLQRLAEHLRSWHKIGPAWNFQTKHIALTSVSVGKIVALKAKTIQTILHWHVFVEQVFYGQHKQMASLYPAQACTILNLKTFSKSASSLALAQPPCIILYPHCKNILERQCPVVSHVPVDYKR